jgi:predicted transglutaminase-like cysteine proteinase
MFIQPQIRKALGVAIALFSATAAHAAPKPFMTIGAAMAPPPGYTDLCQRDEETCGSPSLKVANLNAPAALVLATSSVGATARPSELVDRWPANGMQFQLLRAYRPPVDADIIPFNVERAMSATIDLTPPIAAPAPRPAFEAQAEITAPAAAKPAPAAPAAAVPTYLSKAQLKLINTVNRDVNRDVRAATDFDLYGLLEYWSLPRVIDGKMYGDCEDYALEKRRRLLNMGVPAEALSMAVAVTARGERHAVLVVTFETGDWVLDNLTPWATPWEDMNYTWIQRQVAGSANWVAIG